MAEYRAPLRDIRFVLHELLNVESAWQVLPTHAQLDADMVNQVLEEAAKFCEGVLFPLNATGDHEGCHFDKGAVTTPAGFKSAYKQYVESGWPALACDDVYGGQGLPVTINNTFYELLNSANQAWTMYPGLSHGAYEALDAHGTPAQKQQFLPKLTSGEWTGTMCLTEPHCGTDLGILRSKALVAPDGDGYLISGEKIFISSGEHDLTENIVHLVLARLPDAPAGTKGISLFVVPKFLSDANGVIGARNPVTCTGIEHKMGIHGNATCQIHLDGARGWLVGEPNRGLQAMFVMMNTARLGVGMQGLGLTEAAYQQSLAYAKERLQMRSLTGIKAPDKPADPIIEHPDVRRLLLTQRAYAEGARAFTSWLALQIDVMHKHPDAATRKAAEDHVALLTPIAKAFLTDNAFECTNHAVQVFGGHGYIRETGIEQYVRDARINMIYEGTNAVQALDLLGRKILGDMGMKLSQFGQLIIAFIELQKNAPEMAEFVAPLALLGQEVKKLTAEVGMAAMQNRDEVGAAAVPYLRVVGHLVFAYFWARMARTAFDALQSDAAALTDEGGAVFYQTKLATARFYFAKLLPEALTQAALVRTGADVMMTDGPAAFSADGKVTKAFDRVSALFAAPSAASAASKGDKAASSTSATTSPVSRPMVDAAVVTAFVPSQWRVRKVAVLGAGVMGAQIAAHLVNARIPVVLFDLATKSDNAAAGKPAKAAPRSAIALQAIERLKKLKPAPLGNPADVAYLQAANYDDDLGLLADCDLVIEAIAERLDWKHDLYRKVAPALGPNTIFASNTSGLSIASLAQGLEGAAASLAERFCGVHFFNPPRYMHLVELIATPATRPDILEALETFLTGVVGKGVVHAKDTPNFIANRVGVFSILAVIARAAQYKLPFDLVDDLTGSRLGRAKSATFRTADVVGLDTMGHVIKTMQEGLPDDPFAAHYATPPVLRALVESGALGQKSGAGFYKKVGKDILVLDAEKAATGLRGDGVYQASGTKASDEIKQILKLKPVERFAALREAAGRNDAQAQFLWSIFSDVFHYVAVHLESIADNARDVDFAIRWGFGWNEGPFELWQAAGWRQVAEWVRDDIAASKSLSSVPLPAWVFDGPVDANGGVHSPDGSWSPTQKRFVPRSTLSAYARQIFPARVFGTQRDTNADPTKRGTTVFENAGARLWVDDVAGADGSANPDVLILSFRSKMNTIGPDVLDAIRRGVTLAEESYRGLVIWQPTSLTLGTPGGPFSAGADLAAAMPKFMLGGAAGVEPFIAEFQQTMQCVKYAQVPVVVALSGIALGGGCELTLHAARRVAHIETYLGLVEIGVGVVPAGGGLKEAAIAAARVAGQFDSKRYLDFLTPRFKYAATAQVSTSAHEALQMGYLQPSDPIVFNVHDLLGAGIREARALSLSGYRPPLPNGLIPVAGRSAAATIRSQLVNLRDGGFISAHDAEIATRIADIVCGGDVDAGTLVTEQWLLDLERRAFVDLLGTQKTQERIAGLLQGGKPPRN
jgi:3-hydroxyacyl-CoA dehydrogenase